MHMTGLVRPGCDISKAQLHSSVQNVSGPDVVFWISLFTTPDCNLGYFVNRIMTVIGENINISFELADRLDFVLHFDTTTTFRYTKPTKNSNIQPQGDIMRNALPRRENQRVPKSGLRLYRSQILRKESYSDQF